MLRQSLNPFPGLRSFEPDEEHLFFGREKQVDELLRRLRTTRFLAVVGASGSGKSSLVNSGLIPALHGGYMAAAGSNWRIALMRPGADPIGNLAAALDEPEVVGAGPALGDLSRPLLETTLRRSALGLAESVSYAHLPFVDNVLVVVDQFEELFRFKRARATADARDEAVAFVKLLVEAVRQERPKVFVVLTMRSEFIGQCTEFPGLAEAVNEGQYLVPRMSREELRLAITGPVAVAAAGITPRLVTRLLNDVGDDPDQLPILQHALMRTWNDWAVRDAGDSPIDLAHYEATGTMRDALSRHADEAYADLATERERHIAERVFKALVEMTPHAGGVRRPCRVDELSAAIEADPVEIVRVVDLFRMPGRSFLMPPPHVALTHSTIVDLSHESLIRLWGRLIGWTQEEAQSAEVLGRLSEAAALHDRLEAGLWRDPELQLAINWRDARRPTAPWAARYAPNFPDVMTFLDKSQAARDSEIAARDREIAERERHRRQRLIAARIAVVVLAVLCLLAGSSLVVAVRQRARAENAAADALAAQELATVQTRLAEEQARLARNALELASLEGKRAEMERANAEAAARSADEQRMEAQGARVVADKEREEAERQRVEAETQRQVAVEQRAKAEAASRSAGAARDAAVASFNDADAAAKKARALQVEQERQQYLSLARALAGHAVGSFDSAEVSVLVARQGYNLAAMHGGNPRSPDITNALRIALENFAPRNLNLFVGHTDAVRDVAVSAEGQLITGSDDGRVRAFDAGDGSRQAVVIANLGSPVRSVALDANGTMLAAGTFDGDIHVWKYPIVNRQPTLLKEWRGHTDAVSDLAFDGTGRLVSVGFDGQINIWQPGTFEPGTKLEKQPTRLLGLALSPQNDRVAVASDAGGLLVWQLPAGSAGPVKFGGDVDIQVSSVAFTPDGLRLIAGTPTGQLLLWNVSEPRGTPREFMARHRARITSLRFAGRTLVSGSLDGEVKVWDASQDLLRDEPLILEHGAWVWAMAASREGDRVFSAGADGRVRAWATNADTLAEEACRQVGRNLTEAEWRLHVSAFEPYAPTCPDIVDRRERARLP